MANMAAQKSAYLLEQATSPVSWYPWGEEAAAKARADDKLVFLSIGYSTCHWCHVMDRESFGNKEIEKILQERYVCIRVDREERPDVDRLYMTFVQAAHGNGGWPLNVWLTPDLKPIYGCSYLPPDEKAAAQGRPSLQALLKRMDKKWASEKATLQASADSIVLALESEGAAHASSETHAAMPNGNAAAPSHGHKETPAQLPTTDPWATDCFAALLKQYDSANGGFGRSPKFPQPSTLGFLLAYNTYLIRGKKNTSSAELARDMALKTLRHMAYGGIRDHIRGGFHRYSRDETWHVPHFEKTLCDQAQLAMIYATAYQISDDQFYADVCNDILDYASYRLSHKLGGFYSGEDADSLPTPDATEKKEGAFYAWTTDELQKVLSRPIASAPGVTHADVYMHHYNAKIGGNVDPYEEDHCELDGKNVLHAKHSMEEAAKAYGCVQQEVRDVLGRSRQILVDALEAGDLLNKPRPQVDYKLITGWNGLMVSAYARCAQVLNKGQYAEIAIATAQFIKDKLYDEQSNSLMRNCYGDGYTVVQLEKPIQGFAEDYAFVIRGLLDLYEAVFDDQWLAFAEKLQQRQDELFWDAEHGAYFNTQANDPTIVARIKEEQDGAEPSASSVAAGNLLRLAAITGDQAYQQRAVTTLAFFERHLKEVPMALPELVTARMMYSHGLRQIVVRGDKDARETKILKRTVQELHIPDKVLVWSDKSQKWLSERVPFYATLEAADDRPAVFICSKFHSTGQYTDSDELETVLRGQAVQSRSCAIL